MKKKKIIPHLSAEDKILIIRQVIKGKSVSDLSRERKISRTIIYKWLKQYVNTSPSKLRKVLSAKNPSGKTHWRHIHGIEERVLQLVLANIEYSIDKIYSLLKAEGILISRSGLYYVLKRLSLATYQDRLKYSASQVLVSRQVLRLPEYHLPEAPRYSFNKIALFIELIFLAFTSFIASFYLLEHIAQRSNNNPSVIYTTHDIASNLEQKLLNSKSDSKRFIYIVKAGDSLWYISEEIYESGYNWPDIAKANKLANPDYIEIGQKLVIPVVPSRIEAISPFLGVFLRERS